MIFSIALMLFLFFSLPPSVANSEVPPRCKFMRVVQMQQMFDFGDKVLARAENGYTYEYERMEGSWTPDDNFVCVHSL